MQHATKFIMLVLLSLSVAACTKPTLEERLAGKTGAEREQEAYSACLEYSRYPTPGGHPHGSRGQKIHMRNLCDAMHETHEQKEK